MPTDTERREAEVLADLLDGRLAPDDVPAELADLLELVELADAVRTHVPVPLPSDAFREALRDEVVRSATAPTLGGGAATTVASTTTGAGGGLAAVVAGLAATAVLAASTVAAADRAGPGDLLAGLDRGLESLQLAVADDATEAELLVEFAAERVLEALTVADVAVVNELLAEAEELLAQALDLAASAGLDVDELVRPYAGALVTLSSRTDEPVVRARLATLLDDVGGAPLAPSAPTTGDAGADDAADDGAGDDNPGDDGATGQDGATGDSTDDGRGDATGDVTDPVDDVVDDATDPVDDLVDDPTAPVDDLVDDLDDVTDPLDEATDPLG